MVLTPFLFDSYWSWLDHAALILKLIWGHAEAGLRSVMLTLFWFLSVYGVVLELRGERQQYFKKKGSFKMI